MKTILAMLLIGILLVSGCVSQPGGTTSSSSSGGPPAFPEGQAGSGKAVLPTGKVTGSGSPFSEGY